MPGIFPGASDSGTAFEGFWEKYLSYGKFAGTVTVRILTESERMDLEGFLQRNYHGKKTASVSARRFEEALAGSRFAGIGGKEALELYFQRTPVDKKEQRRGRRTVGESAGKNRKGRAPAGTGAQQGGSG